ncbi:NUDIX hydrolase domain-like protein [Mycena amicta]|nr:NUDIX hydrolase domain-like protein [Mycena amicta]
MSATFTVSAAVQDRDIPLDALRAAHPGKRVTVGVAVIAKNVLGVDQLLLLQRAADEEAYPNMYELPGGNWEEIDTTILHTVAREALEETGLVVTCITNEFAGFEYTTRRGDAQQLNFIVQVQNPAEGGLPSPTLNPKEHQAFAWVGPADSLSDFPMSESMSKVVKDALKEIQAVGAVKYAAFAAHSSNLRRHELSYQC